MANYVNKNGTTGVDDLTYNKEGTYHAYAGNDTIKITGGSRVIVYADSGYNTISVTGGSDHTVKIAVTNAESDKANGADKLTVNGANTVDSYLGAGKDVITLANTNGRKSDGALCQIHGGAWGDIFYVNAGTQRYQLYGDAGNDEFNITAGQYMVFWGGAASDTFNVTGGTNNKLYGGDSADIFNIAASKQNIILGYGNDTVTVTAGDEQQIKANLGVNTINLRAGNKHIITADIDQTASKKAGKDVGYGVDKVSISGTANEVTANLGDGKDIVSVSGGSGHKIYTEGWGDTINIMGYVKNSIFDSGSGNDIIKVTGGANNTIIVGDGKDIVEVTGGSVAKITSGGIGSLDLTVSGAGQVKEIFVDKGTANIVINNDKAVEKLTLGEAAKGVSAQLGAGNDLIEDNGKKSFVIADTGDDKLTIGMNTNEGTYYGGAGNDTISVSGGRNIVYGDYNNNNGYKFDAAGTTYNDIITLEANSYTNKIYAGKGNDTIDMKSYYTNEVYAGDGDDTVYVSTEYYDRDRNDIYSYNPYAKVSGGAGNDTFKVTGSWNTDTVLLFGGSGNDTFELNTDMYFAYGGAGADTFYINNHHDNQFLTGGAGNDTYYVELSESSKYEAEGTKTLFFNIDNSLYHEASDTDTLKIIGADGKLENMKLSYYGIHDVVPTYWLEFSTDTGSYCFNIKGFEHLALQFQDTNGQWTNYNSGLELQQELEKIDNSRYSAISLFDWNFYYDSYYGGAIERTFGSVDDFMSREADFKVYGNGK